MLSTGTAGWVGAHFVQAGHDELVHALPSRRGSASDVRGIARQIEELQGSGWVRQLGTPRPVSEHRIYRAIDAVPNRL